MNRRSLFLSSLCALFASTSTAIADWQIDEKIKITDTYTFGIRGKHNDGYAIIKDGKPVFGDWLHKNVKNPGQLVESDVEFRSSGDDVTIAFRFGKNNDLLY